MVPCYICATPCKDWGTGYYSCCAQCSSDILVEEDCVPDFSDNGFPSEYDDAIAKVKSRIKHKYSKECPCGIHPADCEYHR